MRPDRYYTLRYRHEGKDREEGLGWSSQGWTEKRAAEHLAELRKAARTGEGERTLEEKRQSAAARREAAERNRLEEASKGSLQELFEAYVENLKAQGRRSWKEVDRVLLSGKRAAVKALGATAPAKTIGARDIQKLLSETRKRGPSTAAHLRTYLHGAFAFGIGSEFDYTRPKQGVSFDLEANPVAAIPRDRTAFKVGDRALTSEEVRRVWNDLSEYCEEPTWQAIRLILATGGQRVQEVLHAPFAEFDLQQSLWLLPAARAKNCREHHVPLSERAVSIVARMRDIAPAGCVWLFPHKKDASRPMPSTSLNRAVVRYCATTGMRPWTPRDLRRTCRTLLASEGVPSHVLNWHFNHGVQGVGERHYDRSQHMNEKVDVLVKWEGILAKITGGQKRRAKVLHLYGKD